MGDLNRGDTFAAGETVTHSRLHALVDDATIQNSAVTTAKIADGAVTTAKLAGALAVPPGNVSLTSGKILGGNGSNVGEAVTVGATLSLSAATIGVATGGIAAAQLATDAVETAKIKDSNVTTAKIADNAVTLAKQASMTDGKLLGRSAGSAGIPQEITVGTGLTLASGTLSSSAALAQLSWSPAGTVASLAVGSSTTLASSGFVAAPEILLGWIICTTTDLGYDVGDKVPFASCVQQWGSGFVAAFGVSTSTAASYPLTLTRKNSTGGSTVYVPHKTTGAMTALTDETYWAFRIYALKLT